MQALSNSTGAIQPIRKTYARRSQGGGEKLYYKDPKHRDLLFGLRRWKLRKLAATTPANANSPAAGK